MTVKWCAPFEVNKRPRNHETF